MVETNVIFGVIIFIGILGGLFLAIKFLFDTRCPNCKKFFARKEKAEREDCGIKNCEQEYTSVLYKTRSGETIDRKTEKVLWPTRIVKKLFFCKNCNHEWKSGELKSHIENKEEFDKKYGSPKVVYVKKIKSGTNGLTGEAEYSYVREDGKNSGQIIQKRIPIPSGIKTEVKERAEYRCQMCGDEEIDGDIHHIDENPANSFNINNLIYLCPNCHRKVPSMNKEKLKFLSKKVHSPISKQHHFIHKDK